MALEADINRHCFKVPLRAKKMQTETRRGKIGASRAKAASGLAAGLEQ
jgi:hypothetical protein